MKKLELLAPAGSKEAFICAVDAGADAVYCGLKNFSARNKAQNFMPQEFFNCVNFAHKNNVKVYTALNTLIKQNEIKEAAKELNFIAQAGADAVIVQDFGIVLLVKKYFPQLKVHASAQMGVCNSLGVLQAQKAGIKRTVLARELSLEEIKNIVQKTQCEIEIFVHGALCFSVSGLCLMSSFIGGFSANRGRCAQPCRRLWSVSNRRGFYISPKDLDLARHINELKNSGVRSLKIEGRMKSPQYVYKTVKAYRTIIDDSSAAALKEAQKILAGDFARSKTSFNFIKKSEDIFQPEIPKQTGVYLGKILSYKDGVLTVKPEYEIKNGDILKAADAKNDSYYKITAHNIKFENGLCFITSHERLLKEGMDLFKISDADFQDALDAVIKKADIGKESLNAKEISIHTPKFSKSENEGDLFVKIDDIKWIDFLRNIKCKIIFSLAKENIKAAASLQNIPYYELPPYIEQEDLPIFQNSICALTKNNKNKFFINNIGHFQFFKNPQTELFGGSFLYALNAFAAQFIIKNNITNFVCPIESDLQNVSELASAGLSGKMIFYLSGFPALAFSLMNPCKDLKDGGILESEKDFFKVINKSGKMIILPKYPIMLFNKKEKLKKLSINKFLIDLSFIAPNASYLRFVIDAYNGKISVSNACEFNFERRLK